jgi:hypothetical protein
MFLNRWMPSSRRRVVALAFKEQLIVDFTNR